MDDRELDAALAENIRLGLMELTGEVDAEGHPTFRMTDAGIARVDEILKENPFLFIDMGLDRRIQ